MEIVTIRYKSRYDDCEEIVGVAMNMDVAKEYVEKLKTANPYAYGDNYGTYYFETYKVIEEIK